MTRSNLNLTQRTRPAHTTTSSDAPSQQHASCFAGRGGFVCIAAPNGYAPLLLFRYSLRVCGGKKLKNMPPEAQQQLYTKTKRAKPADRCKRHHHESTETKIHRQNPRPTTTACRRPGYYCRSDVSPPSSFDSKVHHAQVLLP